jgi:hypothetical protein
LADVFACCAEGTEGIEHVRVDLPGVRLTGDDEGRLEASFLCHKIIELFYLGMVAVEDLEK